MSPDGSVKPPPEEKLLRLIRGKAAAKPAPESAPMSPQAVAAAAVSVRAQRVELGPEWSQWPIGALAAILAAEAVALVILLAWPVPKPAVPVIPQAVVSTGPQPVDPSMSPMPEIPSISAAASRAVFAPSAGGAASGGTTVIAAPSGSATLLSGRLTLMGIVSGNPPQAIIGDSQTQKTHFVSVGQPVAEGAVLEEILDNRVILNYSGERIDLNL